jgi:nucleosome assembly protein 1-like 1
MADMGLASIPPALGKKIDAMKELQAEYEVVEEAYKAERIALEQKYLPQKQELWAKRTAYVSGAKDSELEVAPGETDEDEIKGVPGFWVQCLANHPEIGEFIHEDDVPILASISDITIEYSDDMKIFKVLFHFQENEFFSNDVLTKTYTVDPDLVSDKAGELEEIDSCTIEWKEGKDVTKKEVKKKQRSKGSKNKPPQTRTITKIEPQPSFFHYFSDPVDPDEDEEEEEDDEKPKIQLDFEDDYGIGYAIRTDLVPQAVFWYTGELMPDDDDESAEEDDEDEDGDDESGDEDVEALDDDQPSGADKRAFGAPSSSGANGENPPECKQN